MTDVDDARRLDGVGVAEAETLFGRIRLDELRDAGLVRFVPSTVRYRYIPDLEGLRPETPVERPTERVVHPLTEIAFARVRYVDGEEAWLSSREKRWHVWSTTPGIKHLSGADVRVHTTHVVEVITHGDLRRESPTVFEYASRLRYPVSADRVHDRLRRVPGSSRIIVSAVGTHSTEELIALRDALTTIIDQQEDRPW